MNRGAARADKRAGKADSLLSPGVYLALLMACAAAISFFVWMGQGLRLDEAQSIWQTSRSLGGVFNVIAKDVHVPLYFVGLHYWELIFGTTATALRSFSLIFFLVSIPAMFYFARDAYNERVAYLSALLMTLSPFLNWYGSEARMYSLMLLLTIISHHLYIKLWKQSAHPKSTLWFWYGLVTILGLFTHIFFFFVAMVQGLYFLARRELFPKKALNYLLTIALVAGAGFLAWFVYRYFAGAGLTNPALTRPTTVDFFNVFSNFFIGFQTDAVNTIFLSLWPLLVFVGFTLLAKKRPHEPQTTYFMAASLAPIVVAFVVSATFQPIFLSRYLIICLPTLYLLTVYFLSSYSGAARDLTLGAVIAAMIGMLAVQAISPQSPVKEDFRAATAYVQSKATPSDLFVVSAPFITYPVEYYYNGAASLTTFPRWDRYAKDKVAQPYSESALQDAAAKWSGIYSKLYLLQGYDQGYEEEMRLFMDKHYQRLEKVEFSPGLTLYVYKLRYL